MTKLPAFAKKSLNDQGFGKLDDAAKADYALPLRFTPGVSTLLIVLALAWQSPWGLGLMVLVALSGAFFPNGMLIDLVYNFGVRHLFHAPPLPPTPKPRQFSYLLSATFLAGSALAFYYGQAVLGLILGSLVVIGGTMLTLTLWCLGSWYYRLFFKPAITE